MRLIRGETLQEAIDRYHSDESKRLDPGERTLALRRLLGRFVEICQTINYAHGQGVLHRDIKPANVMLGPHGEALVVDWGLAKVMGKGDLPREGSDADADPTLSGEGAMTQAGASIGTPAYMSPEQAEGDLDRIGPASDIYSLGAMLYQILTGRPPIQGKTLAEFLGKVKQGDFPRPRKLDRKLPKTLEAVALKAMAFRPEARYGTARALADDLERWMAGEPTSARHQVFPQRLWRWARRRPDLAFYILVLAAGDLLYGGELVDPFVARMGIDPRFYILFVVVALTCLALPFFAIIISQFPMAAGALVGGIYGLARGNMKRGIRRGASLGAKVGLIAGSVVVIGFFATIGPDFIEKISSSSPSPVPARDSAEASELAKHQGTWLLVAEEIEGMKSPAHQMGGVTRIVTGGTSSEFRGRIPRSRRSSSTPRPAPKRMMRSSTAGLIRE